MKLAVFGLNFLPGFWTWQILWIVPILTGFGPHPRGPKSGQGQLADLDALGLDVFYRPDKRFLLYFVVCRRQKLITGVEGHYRKVAGSEGPEIYFYYKNW